MFARTVRRSASAAATGLAALALGATPAAAHPDTSATAASLCGSSYFVVKDPDGSPARRAVKTAGGAVLGHVYLLYSNSTRKNCVVTIKSRHHGQRSYTYAGLRVQGKSGPCGTEHWFCDDGYFEHFAGGPPRYKTTVAAGGRCVQYYGIMVSPSGVPATGGRLRWGNCGG